jgi:hypothetical protein
LLPPVKTPISSDVSVSNRFGFIRLTSGAGNVQFLFDLYDKAATISSSSITTI